MCSACCGGPVSRMASAKRKGLKPFKFTVKPATLAGTENKWRDAVLAMGWKVVREDHVPSAHYYNSNEVWDDHVFLLERKGEYAVLKCVRAPMRGANVMTGGASKQTRIPGLVVRNPAFDPANRFAMEKANVPFNVTPNAKQIKEHVKKILKGFVATNEEKATENYDKLLAGWLKAAGRKSSKTPVKINLMSKDRDSAKAVLERKGWKVTVAK